MKQSCNGFHLSSIARSNLIRINRYDTTRGKHMSRSLLLIWYLMLVFAIKILIMRPLYGSEGLCMPSLDFEWQK